jgi:hypothetical protein
VKCPVVCDGNESVVKVRGCCYEVLAQDSYQEY